MAFTQFLCLPYHEGLFFFLIFSGFFLHTPGSGGSLCVHKEIFFPLNNGFDK
jgi:hypothetical protein